MDFRRNSQRRRRVALEQTQSESPAANSAAPDRSSDELAPANPYTQEAKRSSQPKTTDLIPKRIWSVIAVAAAFLAVGAGINILHHQSQHWVEVIGAQGVEVFSLNGDRGLAVWYSNFLLLLTSCASLQIFMIRQHRRDDYRGSYRLWLWLAALFMLGSMATVTGIQQMFQNVASFVLSTGASNGVVVLVVVKFCLLVGLIARGIFEIRHSHAALIGLTTVFLGYAAVVLMDLPEVHSQVSSGFETAYGNLLLFGNTALFLTVLTFARFVYLEANGLISAQIRTIVEPRPESNKKQKAEPAKSTAKTSRQKKKQELDEAKQDPAETGVAKTKSKKKKASSTETEIEKEPAKPASDKQSTGRQAKPVSEDDEFLLMLDEDETAALSKSERRRLRKLKKRQQRQAA